MNNSLLSQVILSVLGDCGAQWLSRRAEIRQNKIRILLILIGVPSLSVSTPFLILPYILCNYSIPASSAIRPALSVLSQ